MPFALAVLALIFAAACGRPTGVPQPSPGDPQKLPFDRQPSSEGVSPSQSLIPPARGLTEGTSITIRLRKPLSNSSAHAGDRFEGIIDEPVVVDGQTLIGHGTTVTGHVLDAQPSLGRRPGYLRITLVSVDVGGKPVPIDTSSIFAKGKTTAQGSHPGASSGDVAFTPERRLTFHLAQATDLP